MSEALIRALGQDTVKLQIGVSVDVNVGLDTLLSHSEVFLAGMDRDGANSISVTSIDRRLLLRLQVIGLILVSGDENDDMR